MLDLCLRMGLFGSVQETALSIAEKLGVPLVILMFVGYCTVWAGRRLLAKDDGIISIVATRHVEFLDAMEIQQVEMLTLTRKVVKLEEEGLTTTADISGTLERLTDQHDSEHSKFATVRLHRAGAHACEVLEKICRELGVNADKEIQAVRMELAEGNA